MMDLSALIVSTFGNMRQLGQELVELLLALVEFSAAHKVDPEESHDAVDDQEAVLIAHEVLGDLVEQFELVFRVDGSGIGDIILG